VSPAARDPDHRRDVAIGNAEQARLWDGDEGSHWVAHQTRYDAIMGTFTERLLAAAALADGDRVLDLGCGCGQTTRLAARRTPSGLALGIDLSTAMLDRARAQAHEEGITNAHYDRGDAQIYPFAPETFDVAISRFGVMFFDDPVVAFTNIRKAVRAGGWITFLTWRDLVRNEWITVPATAALAHVPFPELDAPDAPGPFSLADPDRITRILERAGYDEITTTPIEAPMPLGRDADDVVSFIAGTDIARTLLDQVDPPTAAKALDAVRDALRPHEGPDGIALGGAAWLVAARRP
jgi:SAM-dependent methyltransferase